MKFKTSSSVKIALYLSLRQNRIFGTPLLRDKIFGAVTRIRPETMSGPIKKLIGTVKTWLQGYMEEASSFLSSTVEEKTVMEDELWGKEVIACINTNTSL